MPVEWTLAAPKRVCLSGLSCGFEHRDGVMPGRHAPMDVVQICFADPQQLEWRRRCGGEGARRHLPCLSRGLEVLRVTGMQAPGSCKRVGPAEPQCVPCGCAKKVRFRIGGGHWRTGPQPFVDRGFEACLVAAAGSWLGAGFSGGEAGQPAGFGGLRARLGGLLGRDMQAAGDNGEASPWLYPMPSKG